MATDWKPAYTAALRETTPNKVVLACNHARRLINDRTLEAGAEMKELEESLRQLLIYQVGKCGVTNV